MSVPAGRFFIDISLGIQHTDLAQLFTTSSKLIYDLNQIGIYRPTDELRLQILPVRDRKENSVTLFTPSF